MGGFLCGRTRAGQVADDQVGYTTDAVESCRLMTFQRSVLSTRARVSAFSDAGLSLRNRSGTWNVYIVSTTPYPASIIPAGPVQHRALRAELSKLFPTGAWIKRDMAWNLGMALGLRGSPRDPKLVTDVASIVALCRGGIAGPPEGQRRILRLLARIGDGWW